MAAAVFPEQTCFLAFAEAADVLSEFDIPIAIYVVRLLALKPQGQFALKVWHAIKIERSNATLCALLACGRAALVNDGGADAQQVTLADSQCLIYGDWTLEPGRRIALSARAVVHSVDRHAPLLGHSLALYPRAFAVAMREARTPPSRLRPCATYRLAATVQATYDLSDPTRAQASANTLGRVDRLFLPGAAGACDAVGVPMARIPDDDALAVWPAIVPPGPVVILGYTAEQAAALAAPSPACSPAGDSAAREALGGGVAAEASASSVLESADDDVWTSEQSSDDAAATAPRGFARLVRPLAAAGAADRPPTR